MATFAGAADENAYGGEFESPQWTTIMMTFNLDNSGTMAYARWGSAAAVLAAASITTATLTISGIGSPTTTEVLRVYGDKTGSDENLPEDWTEAQARTLTTANASESVENLATVEIDIKTIIEELVSAIDGAELILRIDNSNYSGTGLGGMTATINIDYVPILACWPFVPMTANGGNCGSPFPTMGAM